MPESRRDEALRLAEDLLGDIEYSRIGPSDVVRKASRLARLTDDAEAMTWLRFEMAGYTRPENGYMSEAEVVAAERSGRVMTIDQETGRRTYKVQSIGEIQAHIAAADASLAALTGAGASGEYALLVENSRRDQRWTAWNRVAAERAYLDSILGAVHSYASDRYQELRFGSTVESAFDTLRAEVDSIISDLVPSALPRLTAAMENASSESPEHWANAASTCRKLLKEVADAIRPPGPDVEGRKMGGDQYINRIVDWITQQPASETLRDVVLADLQYLGARLHAVADAGHKGAHADVSRFDAARFLVGTYVLLGDILRLGNPVPPTSPASPGAVGAPSEVVVDSDDLKAPDS